MKQKESKRENETKNQRERMKQKESTRENETERIKERE